MAGKTPETPSDMVGKKAPDFALPDQDCKTHKLSDYKGRYVVLFWYPKDDTPGCTREMCGFRDLSAEFAAAEAVVLGISILGTESKRKFASKFGVTFPLLADEDHAVAEAYGVWKEKSMYGKKFMGISRETFLINPDGVVAEHWPKASGSEEHSADVLARLGELKLK